jgi:hypothetical protein
MAHSIQAIIGRDKTLERLEKKWKNAKVVSFPQNISVIPLTYDLRNEINNDTRAANKAFSDYFGFASEILIDILREESRNGQVGYIETDYFGGTGSQSSILFMNGETIGPFKTESSERNKPYAINKVLSMLGVEKQEAHDEFDALGFVHLRSNDDILKKYGS